MRTVWATMPSPVGELLLVSDGEHLTAVSFAPFDSPASEPEPDHPVLSRAREQLADYFAGQRHEFDLPLSPSGTPFQLRVWAALRDIPYGSTVSYGEVARGIGLPAGTSRAVGAANGRNPLAVVVPCHRVIGSDGSLTGYAGGVVRKHTLLQLESPGLF